MGVENGNGVQKYIPEVLERGLTDVMEDQLAEVTQIFGKELFIEPGPKEKARSKRYARSQFKRAIDVALATTILSLGGEALIDRTLDRVGAKSSNGSREYFWLPVSFLGMPEVLIPKVPTMREGAKDELKNPFSATSLIGGRSTEKDQRILDGEAQNVRKNSLDEFPQLLSLKSGEMTVVGSRAYYDLENHGTAILEKLCAQGDIDFSDSAKWILSRYRSTMAEFNPKPALLSLSSAYKSKDTDHYIRLLFDMAYSWHASPLLDMKIVALTAVNRGLKKKGAR